MRNQKSYSEDFKLKVAREYMETDLSQVDLLEKYKIKGKSSITNWVRRFDLKATPEIKKGMVYQGRNMKKGIEKTKAERVLEKKVKELKKQLEYEKLRSEAFDTMITIAEKKFDIPIRKKRGTKQ